MAKQALKITIDEDILEQVKNNIPNISEFVEGCFISYLTFAIENEEERGEELRKAWETFHKAKLDIHLLMKIDYKDKNIQNAIIKQKNQAWLTVWSDYRRVGSTQYNKIEKASKKLEITTEELKQVLEDTLFKAKQDMTKLYIYDDWHYIQENILPYIETEENEGGLDDLLKNL